jgi:hypothetical protein
MSAGVGLEAARDAAVAGVVPAGVVDAAGGRAIHRLAVRRHTGDAAAARTGDGTPAASAAGRGETARVGLLPGIAVRAAALGRDESDEGDDQKSQTPHGEEIVSLLTFAVKLLPLTLGVESLQPKALDVRVEKRESAQPSYTNVNHWLHVPVC